jgi:hypothetical protein
LLFELTEKGLGKLAWQLIQNDGGVGKSCDSSAHLSLPMAWEYLPCSSPPLPD